MLSGSTRILGISAFYHDSAAALIVDGEIVAAAQEERFTRKKHDHHFPRNAVAYCLREAGLDPVDLDYVGFYDKPLREVRPADRDLRRLRAGRLPSYLQGAAALAARSKLHLPARDAIARSAAQYRGRYRLRRPPRVARGQRLLPVAVRGGRDPDPRRRGRVVDDDAWATAAATGRAHARDPLSALARPALQRVHLLHRLPRQLRRIQGHGPRALRRAALRRPDPRST